MARWAGGRGGTAWSAVTAQLGDATQVAGARLYSKLRLECASLGSSVQAARSATPIPDEVMQRSYAKVLAELAVTSADCQDAITVRTLLVHGASPCSAPLVTLTAVVTSWTEPEPTAR